MGEVMAKENAATKRTRASTAAAVSKSDALEPQVVAFAEQLGRIAGTVQARVEGWLDRDALKEQVTRVRDSASELLEQIGSERLKDAVASMKSKRIAGITTARAANLGRSGGAVDAPGKKHRKPTPSMSVRGNASARANAADLGRLAKMKAAASRRRGRG
jgi:beta-phosphoglucomutase-like phosphatase (HAD superfamily)